MGDKVWAQCQCCGNLHQVKSKDALISDDDLYTNPIWCSKCRDDTKHLLCGENREDVYIYYNLNVDPNYYNTK
jgi:hypothetical protein